MMSKGRLLRVVCILWCLSKVVESGRIPEGHCIWYDICGQNPNKTASLFGSTGLNCPYEGPAKKVRADKVDRLTATCPEMAADILDEFGDLRTCCSPDSIDDLFTQFKLMEPIVERCPACLANLKLDFCYFACHPYQSSFLRPSLLYFDEKTEKECIWEVDFHMHPEYRDKTYASCENVYYPLLSAPSLGLLCGEWGSEYCTPERLFDYFGSNDLAPFDINYIYTDQRQTVTDVYGNVTTMTPFNLDTIYCNTTDEDYTCSCTDCYESCPLIEAVTEEDPPMVGSLQLYVFILVMVFCAFVILVLTVLLCQYRWILKSSATVEKSLQAYFTYHGTVVAKHPFIALGFGALLVTVLCCGLPKVQITNDPVELWAAAGSRSRLEKDYYDEKFGPFYRTTQVIFTAPKRKAFDANIYIEDLEVPLTFGGVFETDIMDIGIDLQLDIMAITAEYEGQNITLNDICIKPLAPQNDVCMVQSIFNYWQNDKEKMQSQYENNEYLDFLLTCINNPTYTETTNNISCLGSYGGVVLPYVALGGFLSQSQTLNDSPDYQNATAIVMTFLNQNYVNHTLLGPALAWEKKFIEYMNNYSNAELEFAFFTERSIEDQVKEIGESDVGTVIISYVIMFLYITLSLGGSLSCHAEAWVNLKVSVGLGGVILVFLSVISSSGFYGYIGLTSTVFVLEVVPFITLAVGVDNIFLLVQTWQRLEKGEEESVEEHVGRVVGKVGPSMLLATVAETVCFFLGALSDMPAVYTFALSAGMALLIDFILQITCFVAILTLDAKRVEANRYDVLYCIKADKKVRKANNKMFVGFFKNFYGPFLMNDYVRACVLIFFAATATTSASFIPKLGIGLDQNIAMPDGSYILKYFEYLEDYLSVGAPIYFVVTEGFDYTQHQEQNLICSENGCDENSMLSQIFYASLTPEITRVATGASSWLEPYFSYMEDGSGAKKRETIQKSCCRLDANETFIATSEPVAENATSTCLSKDQLEGGRPLPEFFMAHLPDYLIDNPHGLYCSQAGHPGFGPAVNVISEGNVSYVGANYFMAYHDLLSTSVQFTDAVYQAYQLCDSITQYLRDNSNSSSVEVFPYSIFYVYYEQYMSMWQNAERILGISLASLLLVMSVATGFDILSAVINLLIIFLILVHVMGCMYAWNIELNAISLVNLVMVSGISVEFCSHFTRGYNLSLHGDRKTRVVHTLSTTGASILSGIAITKLAGIMVLGFANSQVFVIYYFRMYLLMVIFAVTHGLILLPVILSFIGNPINPYLDESTEAKSEGCVKLMYIQSGITNGALDIKHS